MPTNEGVPPATVGELPQVPASDRVAVSYAMNRMSSPSNEVTPHRVVTISFIIDYVDKKAQVSAFYVIFSPFCFYIIRKAL